MEKRISINRETCNVCGLCEEICPIRIMKKDGEAGIEFRPDRLFLCIQCGQCMAICPSQSIVVDGLAYSQDFFALPAGPVAELPFLEMIKTRRAIRVFKEQPVPRELLEKVVQAITFAPPGFIPIKTEVVVVQDTAVIRQALPEMIKVYDGLIGAMSNGGAIFYSSQDRECEVQDSGATCSAVDEEPSSGVETGDGGHHHALCTGDDRLSCSSRCR